jgi:hypothetical protein
MKLQTRQGSQGDKTGIATGKGRTIRSLAIGLALILSSLVTACQSEYKTVLDPLGPVPGTKGSTVYPMVSTSISSSCPQGQGSLVVKTPTGLAYAGSTMYFPHLSYFIESEKGWRVRCVANHSSRIDEHPQEIQLPAGRYTLVAEADSLGKVRVPLAISSGTLTIVVLQRFRGENDIW